MGIVLDSSVLIAAERSKLPVSDLLASLGNEHRDSAFLLSAISWMELEHGWHPAPTAEIAQRRRRYLDEVQIVIPIEAFTREMGTVAAGVDAGLRKQGIVVSTADLLIGATALFFGYSVGTRNIRHFEVIPGLHIVPL